MKGVFILLICFSIPSAYAKKSHVGIEDYRSWSDSKKVLIHYSLMAVLEKWDQEHPVRSGQTDSFSWHNPLDLFFPKVYAQGIREGLSCVWGGWPSVKRQDRCVAPYKEKKMTGYTSCGGNGVIRCNPKIFGANSNQKNCLAPKKGHDQNGCCTKAARTDRDVTGGSVVRACMSAVFAKEDGEIDPVKIKKHIEKISGDSKALAQYLYVVTRAASYCDGGGLCSVQKHAPCKILSEELSATFDHPSNNPCLFRVVRVFDNIQTLGSLVDFIDDLAIYEFGPVTAKMRQMEQYRRAVSDTSLDWQGSCTPRDIVETFAPRASREGCWNQEKYPEEFDKLGLSFEEGEKRCYCFDNKKKQRLGVKSFLQENLLKQTGDKWGDMNLSQRAQRIYDTAKDIDRELKEIQRRGVDVLGGSKKIKNFITPEVISCLIFKESGHTLNPFGYNYSICKKGKWISTAHGLSQITFRTLNDLLTDYSESSPLRIDPFHTTEGKKYKGLTSAQIHSAVSTNPKYQIELAYHVLNAKAAFAGENRHEALQRYYGGKGRDVYAKKIERCIKCLEDKETMNDCRKRANESL